MATLTGSTIAGTYDQLIKRQDSYSQPGSNIEIMEDDGTIAVTGLYLEGGGGANVGIGVSDADTKLEVFYAGTQLKLSYDANSFATFAVDASDDVTIKTAASGGFRFQATTDTVDYFQVLDADAGTPILNVDSTNERVGIGTAAPVSDLHLGAGSGTPTLTMGLAGSTDGYINAPGSLYINFDSNADGAGEKFQISSNRTGLSGGTEIFTILETGLVGIGLDAPTQPLQVYADLASNYPFMVHNYGNNANRYVATFTGGAYDGSGTTYYIKCEDGNGDVVGTLQHASDTFSADDPSDERIKKDIVDTDREGLPAINALKIRDYKYRKNNIEQTGLIAQEAKEEWADVVHGDENSEDPYKEPMSISYSHLVIPLILAVQELSAKVTALENA